MAHNFKRFVTLRTVLIFILELLSEVKSDCHEILSGALVYGDLQNDQIMEIFKMIKGFCLKWTGSCRNRSKVISFST